MRMTKDVNQHLDITIDGKQKSEDPGCYHRYTANIHQSFHHRQEQLPVEAQRAEDTIAGNINHQMPDDWETNGQLYRINPCPTN